MVVTKDKTEFSPACEYSKQAASLYINNSSINLNNGKSKLWTIPPCSFAATPTEAHPEALQVSFWEQQPESHINWSKILSFAFQERLSSPFNASSSMTGSRPPRVAGPVEAGHPLLRTGPSQRPPTSLLFLSQLTSLILTAPARSTVIKIQNWGESFELPNYLQPHSIFNHFFRN